MELDQTLLDTIVEKLWFHRDAEHEIEKQIKNIGVDYRDANAKFKIGDNVEIWHVDYHGVQKMVGIGYVVATRNRCDLSFRKDMLINLISNMKAMRYTVNGFTKNGGKSTRLAIPSVLNIYECEQDIMNEYYFIKPIK